jgi:hypothetical protein
VEEYIARYHSEFAKGLTVEEHFVAENVADAIMKAIAFIDKLNETCAHDFTLKAITLWYPKL